MKLLVFAHTPPPHHGQSYMVQLMLGGFGGDRRKSRGAPPRVAGPRGGAQAEPGGYQIECYHVNARLSQNLEDIGDFRLGKFIMLVWYCLEAVWCRLRYGVTTLYYIPAPGKPSALYRDWLVMFICRPFFKRVVLHWHAAGLAKWLETVVQMRSRALTYRLMKRVDLSIVLSKYNQADAEKLFSQRIQVVSNGIPDPCPGFEREILPRRRARFGARARLLSGQKLDGAEVEGAGADIQIVRVLYLAHCTSEKGLFDAIAGARIANQRLAEHHSPISVRLLIAGTFVSLDEKSVFDEMLTQPGVANSVQHFGFVSGDQKDQLLREADLFCFPTYYQNENQPVNLIEAMAYGLPILTTRWRSLPELFPAKYPGLVDIHAPDQLADAIIRLSASETGEEFRGMFLRNYTLERHLAALSRAFHSVEHPAPAPAMVPPKTIPVAPVR
jgi:glycosyltransferase involved in cell wall biosynthesis